MPAPAVRPLVPAVRPYAWGSRRFLADLQGRPPAADPEAEAWFGAHPMAPAEVPGPGGSTPLDVVIDTDPDRELGADVIDRFGHQLPFLVKLLAAEAPLSLQAHPSAEQARRGFDVEEALGLPRDAPERNYRDPWPKPELLLALTPFRALCGFREPAETARLIADLDVPALAHVAESLTRNGEGALARAIAWALRDGRDEAVAAVAELRTGAARLRDRVAGTDAGRGDGTGARRWAATADCMLELADRFPGDPGIVVAMLLRLVELAPGDAVHLPAGNLHAYLEGAAVEVMASSDNVLRGGLTPKHVDVAALLDVVDPRCLPPPLVPRIVQDREVVHDAPTPHFRLSELALAETPTALDRRGPQVLIAVGGQATVTANGRSEVVRSGYGAFVSAAARDVWVAGSGRLYRTTVGDPT